MPLSHSYQATPIGSISLVTEQERLGYIQLFHSTPPQIHALLSSPDTGSYVRGLGKSYDVPEDSFPKIAQAIFFIAIGEKSLAQLPAILSTELKLSNDKAQKMATEIEKDVFGPVKAELDEFLRKQKSQSGSMANKLGSTTSAGQVTRRASAYAPQNVLNLKELPARPVQKDFPVRTAPRKPILPPLPGRQAGPPAPPRAGGEAPKFPLPPKPQNPIRFT